MSSFSESGGASPKVLIVDDEEDVLAYVVAVLEDNGFRAVGESDPASALDVIQREHPDLILLDIMMPGQSGLSLYRELRRHRATAAIPVIIISGYSPKEELATVLSRLDCEKVPRPNGYLEKPISVPAFLENVRELLAAPRGE